MKPPAALKLLARREEPRQELTREERELARTLASFQSDTQEIEAQGDPVRARGLVWLLAATILVFITWASLSSIDRVVSARGALQTTLPSVLVQPLDTAIVRSLDANVGDVVKAGQVLMTLDPTFVQADISQLEPKLAALNAQIARLQAEMDGATYSPADAASNPDTALQLKVWQERHADYVARVSSLDEQASGVQAAIAGLESEKRTLEQRNEVLGQIEGMRNELLQNRNGSRLTALQAADARLEVTHKLTQAVGALRENRHKLDALKADRESFIRTWQAKTAADMVTARGDRDSVQEELTKARRKGDLVSLESPVDAVVIERADRAIGSVVKGAEPVYTLLPLNAPLEADIRILGRDIGFVRVGDAVNIKFDAYHYLEHGMVQGEIRTISEDAFPEKGAETHDGRDYYKARVHLTAISLHDVPEGFRLLPGLPLTADIKVGQRTILSYLLYPLLRTVGEAMREP